MNLILILSLILIPFPIAPQAQQINPNSLNAPQAPIFYPNFSQAASVLSKGTLITPICSDPYNCFNQWHQQAIPLSITGKGLPQFNYFFPGFIPTSSSSLNVRNDKDWERVSLINERSSSSKRSKRSFYTKKNDTTNVVMVETNPETEETQAIQGQVFFIPAKYLSLSNGSASAKTSQNTGRVQIIPGQQTETADDISPESDPVSSAEISSDTLALSAGAVTEIQTGCLAIDKRDIKTEAEFCLECIRENNSYFKSLLRSETGFLKSLKDYLNTVSNESKVKVVNQIPGKELSTDRIKEICSPAQTLQDIIKNFEDTCPPYNKKGGFKKFFEESLCKSCKKGVPIELMTALMSIESSGRCTARNDNSREDSAGLFQVNSQIHACTEGHTAGTKKNTECLMDINNNWNKSIEILIDDFYNKTNRKPLTTPCKDWLDMNPSERDAFRRAVAGYNGSYWILDNIRASKQDRNDNTRFGSSYKNDTSNWEEIRAFYFTRNILGSGGRSEEFNLSNLAYTEAILGREVKGGHVGMIEIWSQYKRNFLKENKDFQCKKEN